MDRLKWPVAALELVCVQQKFKALQRPAVQGDIAASPTSFLSPLGCFDGDNSYAARCILSSGCAALEYW